MSTNVLPPLIPRALLFDNPERSGPQLSPDGTHIAYLAPLNGVMNVFVGTTEAAVAQDFAAFIAVTTDAKRGIPAFFWQEDSRHVLYIQDSGGDENWRLYQTDTETQETRCLTPFDNVQVRLVRLDPAFPDVALIGLNQRNPQLHDVYSLNLISGELTLVLENNEGFAGFVADHQLQVRAAQKMLPTGDTEIYVRGTDATDWQLFLSWGADDQGSIAGFTPDGTGLWLRSSLDANATRLLERSLLDGNTTVLAEDAQFDVGGILVNPHTRHLEAVTFDRERTEWQPLDATIAADLTRLQTERDGVIGILSRDREDRLWTVAYVMDNGPTYFTLYDRQAGTNTLLFSDRPALEEYTLAKVTPISYGARDGMQLFGYLTLPPGIEPKNLPTVLFVHGGPWARDSWRFHPSVQLLANRGYAVLQINYRGSSGYGKAYLNAGDLEWAGKMHDDLIDGKAWLIAQGIADPERVAIAGGSYGGYATLVGLTYTPEEFVCGVDVVGPSNLNTLLASIPPYWAPIKAMFTKRMGDNEAFLTARSPLFRVNDITKPLLVLQGANDPRVKLAESDQIVAAMRLAGKPVEYIVFPDEGHGFRRPENNLYYTAAMENFLAKYLGGRAEPFTEIPGSSGEVR